MYSTGAGQVAADGDGRNSPFAQAFLKYMPQPGDITATIQAVMAETKRLTNGAQVPYQYSSLTGHFVLNPKATTDAASTQPATVAIAPSAPPTMTIARTYGSLVVSATKAGSLYLDGTKMGDLPAGATATLNNIEPGNRSLELRYADGPNETQTATVTENKATRVSFTYRKVVPSAIGLPGNFVLVPGGAFTMGSPSSEGGRNKNEIQHKVILSPYAISKFDVTFDEFDVYCTATGAVAPKDMGWGRGSRPVIDVSWLEAVAYCNWRSTQEGRIPAYSISGTNVRWDRTANGYRLPTEPEWEYAGKGGPAASSLTHNAVYAGGANTDQVAWYVDNSDSRTHPVGQKAPNSLGLYDMAGNVWQWCWDWYGVYPKSIQIDPSGPASGDTHVDRGGSCNNFADGLRSAGRDFHNPIALALDIGFRLVVSQIGE
jgi:formylglycine-generating enzyme required for sulfatase activity